MAWDKYVELDDVEYNDKSYESYHASEDFMILSGYDEKKSEKFITIAEAIFKFDKNRDNDRTQLQEAIKDGTLSFENMENAGLDAKEFVLPHVNINQDELLNNIGTIMDNGQSIGYAINYALFKQYNSNNPEHDALTLTTEDTIKHLSETHPDGPNKTKKEISSDGKYKPSVTMRKA